MQIRRLIACGSERRRLQRFRKREAGIVVQSLTAKAIHRLRAWQHSA
jgi:hypothetical protein